MKNSEFDDFVKAFRARQDALILNKGHDYTVGNADADRLYNFKFVASLLGLSPLQVLGVYWLKHVLAIATYIKFGSVKSEEIDGRFLDENNYNLLGRALINDLRKTVSQNPRETTIKEMPSVQKARNSRGSTRNRTHRPIRYASRSNKRKLHGSD